VEPIAALDDLIGKVGLSDVSHSAAKFDPTELGGLNARTLHMLSFTQVRDRLRVFGIDGDAAFWDAVRGNLEKLSDAEIWWDVVSGDETFASEDSDLIQAAIAHLPPEPWTAATWGEWTKAIAQASGKRGRALFHPLRMALTGREQGPELKALLPLMGHMRVIRRLESAR